jgi:phosphatidylglycerophosphate synthase
MPDRPAPPAPTPSPRAPGFPDLGRFWTAANGLTLARIAIVPALGWLVYRGGPMGWLLALVAFAIATDFLDGKVARRFGTVSEWGKVLDPTADKLAAAAVTLALVLRPAEVGPTLPVWFVVLVIARDALIALGGVVQTRRLGFAMMALWSGKVAVALLAATITAVLLSAPQALVEALLAATTGALVYSFGRYFQRYRLVMRLGPDVLLDGRHNVVRRP